MPVLKLYLLGPPRVERAGEAVAIELRKALALLVYLALTERTHSRDALATLLWPELDQSRARGGLRSALAGLKKALGEDLPLEVERETVGLKPGTDFWVDVGEFQDLLAQCRGHGHPEDQVCPACISALTEAAGLYHDGFLAGFTLRDCPGFDEWQFFQTEGLRDDLAHVLERLVRGHTSQGQFELAIDHARRWLALDSMYEPAHRTLMQLYAWSDRRSAALRQYDECVRVLQAELGLSPEEETVELYHAIREKRDLPPPGERMASTAQTDTLNNRYRLDAELGRGGMGIVYRAHDLLLDREVALKVWSSPALGMEGRARLLKEAQAVAKLNHPNIIRVYDVGEADDQPFIVMERAEGRPLSERPPDSLEEIVAAARQICAALEHAHEHGIVHRDLKPENVMVRDGALLDDGGSVKLTDFGLARPVASRVTSEGAIAGTAYYLAPELALGRRFDGRADLYALGVMLYELATGNLPFTADDPLVVISQHLHAAVVPPRTIDPRIPPALDALIVHMMSKDPEDRPVSATEVLRALNAGDILDRGAPVSDGPPVLRQIRRGRIVGREQELQLARSLWSGTLSGQGQLLLMSGEAGVGKTRLARELVTQVRVTGGRALVGASYAEGGVPYDPFVQILRRSLDDSFDDLALPQFVLSSLLVLAPELRRRYPQLEREQALGDPAAEQQRLFENLAIFFSVLSERDPLLLVLEDIHWADSSTLALLRHIARQTRLAAVMIVATFRPVELDRAQPMHEMVLDLNRERLATQVKLSRLDREQTGEMLAALFATEITPEFLDGIYGETEGNPFFIEEVCMALVESGKVYFEDEDWHRPDVAELGIPKSVQVAILSRVNALPAASREVLSLAAVLGRDFGFDTLLEARAHLEAADPDEDRLIDALEDAERAQLIEEVRGDGEGSFSFVHALIPGTLVESMRSLRRRRLHRSAAVVIERRCPSDFEALAHHCQQAGQAAKAADYWLLAGDRARGLYAHQEAQHAYERALALLREQGDDKGAARTLMKLGLVHTSAFQPEEAKAAYQQAFALWEPAPASDREAGLAKPSAVLRFAVLEPPTLDPGMIGDDASAFLAGQLFEGLVGVDHDQNVLPALAARWDVHDGGRRYLFRLRDGLKWSDGAPLTAADFEFAWKRNLAPASRSPVAHLLYVLKNARGYAEGTVKDSDEVGVVALDDQTLEARLEGPTAYLPHLLAHSVARPLPRRVVEALGPSWTEPGKLVGNGAYRLNRQQEGGELVLRRNPHYHGSYAGNVEKVQCLVFAEYGPVLEAYAAGELDGVSMIMSDPGTNEQAQAAFGPELVFTPQPSTFFLAFRTDQPPFDDVVVRRAFVHAVDRKVLARDACKGQYLPGTGGFLPPGMPGHSAGIGLAYDPERARSLLARAGYPGGRGFPEISWLYSGSADNPVVPFLQRAWRENLGLNLVAEGLEWAAYFERRQRDPAHLALGGWLATYPDPDSLLRVVFHSIEGFGPGRWSDPEFDRLVAEAARVTDHQRRMELYHRADCLLVAEEAAVMPLGHAQGRILLKPWVTVPRVPPVQMRFKEVVLQQRAP